MARKIRVHNFIVCDDIRREDNGKAILTGVYLGNMIVPGLPALLSKLSFYFTISGASPGQATLRLYSPHRTLDRKLPVEIANSAESEPGTRALGISISPFIASEDGRYTVLLEFASGEKIRRYFNVVVGEEKEEPE